MFLIPLKSAAYQRSERQKCRPLGHDESWHLTTLRYDESWHLTAVIGGATHALRQRCSINPLFPLSE